MENEIEAPSVKSIALKWGLIAGVISIVLFIGFAMSGLQGASWTQWISYLIMAVIVYMAHKEYKDSGDGYMSYGKGLGLGTLTIFIAWVISSIFSYVYVKFVDTTYMDVIRDKQIEGMVENGMSDAEIETAMGFSEMMFKPEMILVFGIIGGALIGFIISLIISAITKNNNPALEV